MILTAEDDQLMPQADDVTVGNILGKTAINSRQSDKRHLKALHVTGVLANTNSHVGNEIGSDNVP